MADLSKLKEVGEELVPVIKNIIALIKKGKEAKSEDKRPLNAAVRKLARLVSRANVPTPASLGQRSEAIFAVRSALVQTLREAAANNAVSLPSTKVRTIEARIISLRDAHGRLGEMEVFDDIARLLSPGDMQRISTALDGALVEIQERKKAKKILDVTVTTLITAARIVAKVA